MAAWGSKFDENDDAADWLDEFESSPNWLSVDAALDLGEDYVEAPEASIVLAACEVVAAGLGNTSPQLSETVVAWAKANSTDAAQRKSAAKHAAERVRDESELQELWSEAEEFSEWQRHVDETISRL